MRSSVTVLPLAKHHRMDPLLEPMEPFENVRFFTFSLHNFYTFFTYNQPVEICLRKLKKEEQTGKA